MPGTPATTDPAFFAELWDSRTYEYDGVVATSTVRWRVPNAQTGYEACTAAGIPSIGSPHPDPALPNMFLDRIVSNTRMNKEARIVEGLYSTNGRFRTADTRPPHDTQRAYLSVIPERYDLVIPFFIATRRKVPVYSNNSSGQRILSDVLDGWEWVRNDLKYRTQRWVLSREVHLTQFDFATSQAVYDQIGQIHRFPDGSSWQFDAPDIRQTAPSMWRIGYTWMTEMEIPVPGVPNRPGEGTVPADTTIPTDVLSRYFVTATATRPPFYAYQVIPGAFEIGLAAEGVDISVPAVRVFDKFPDFRNNALNPNGLGWTGLPGNPLGEYVGP